MRKIKIYMLMVILFLASFSTASAIKIQKDDKWKYKDKDNVEYNETAFEVIQLVNTVGDPIAAAGILTNRSFAFPIFIFDNITINLSMLYDGIYLTQEGGIPYIPINTTVTGFVNSNDTIYDLSKSTVNWEYHGSPSIALTTTSTIEYYTTIIISWNTTILLQLLNKYIISSNSNFDDKIKNYTITPILHEMFFMDTNRGLNLHQMIDNQLSLSSFETAMKITYDTEVKLPTYIAQTDPVKTGLSLSQSSRIVEYFLVQEDITSTEDEDPLYFMWIIPMIILVMIRRRGYLTK